MNETSCIGCKYLYSEGDGYSNYTVLEQEVKCAKDANPNLPAYMPCDWDADNDNWTRTNSSRCEFYSSGGMVALDVDGEDGPADYIDDEDAISAICAHSGRSRNGEK